MYAATQSERHAALGRIYSVIPPERRSQAAEETRGVYVGTFTDFVSQVNPRYKWYPHVRQLAAVLQRVADDEINRLMVFMPPRHGKSELVSRLFSAYYLLRHPERWVGINSYGAELAYTFSRNSKDNYSRAGGRVKHDAGAVKHWETGQGGGMWAAGVGGPITGKGFHLGIIDDPIKNAEEAHSDTIRAKQKEWYDSTFYTREEPGAAIVVIQTRWHDDDLSGYLLEQEDKEPEYWHIVHFEAIKEEVPTPYPATCILEPDARKGGEALAPMRYTKEKLEKISRRIGPYFFGALYQQRPVPLEGGMFKREWFDIEDGRNRYSVHDTAVANQVIYRYQFWDTALKDKRQNDPSMCITIDMLPSYTMLLRDVWTDRIESAYLPEQIEAQARRWNFDNKLEDVVIEDKGSGTTAIQTIRKNAPQWLADKIMEFTPHGSKDYRARTASMWMPRDCFWLPYPDEALLWYTDLLDDLKGQFFRFAGEGTTPHDEFIDCVSMCVLYLEHFISQGFYARLANMDAHPQRPGRGLPDRIKQALAEEQYD